MSVKILIAIHIENDKGKHHVDHTVEDSWINARRFVNVYKPKRNYEVTQIVMEKVSTLL